MFKRILPFAVLGVLVLSMAGCGGAEEPKKARTRNGSARRRSPLKKAGPVYEITKDQITSHPGWTSRNVSVLGVKLGDKTRDVEKNLGAVENARTTGRRLLDHLPGQRPFCLHVQDHRQGAKLKSTRRSPRKSPTRNSKSF